MENNYHLLGILVEQDLYRRIVAIREGNFANKNEEIKTKIQLFENNLPDYLKKLPKVHEFIVEKINDTDKRLQKIKEEREKEKSIKEQER